MASNLKYWYLHDHKLFRNLNFAEINALCILKRFKKSKRNEILDLPFSEKERIYFLKKGTIKLIKIEENGEETVIDVLK
ncbi:MAG: Crp/Fnr family transcriptional regulator, partial [Bacteroidota bacterium]